MQLENLKVGVIGLGYVGLPLAVEFAKYYDVVGFDIETAKIENYRNGIDVTGEVGASGLEKTTMKFSDDEADLADVNFYIVTVPTPINQDHTPNLGPIEGATRQIAKYLSQGDIVVYESTVYPGLTEDFCAPLLDEISGLTCGQDYGIGYSPERINPGDRVNTIAHIVKIVSGINKETLEAVSDVYSRVITAGIHQAPSIKVAESAKVVENSQRDINIAFMNELAQVFELMDINTYDVLEAMNTKWNSLGFYPGLVGGHCIGVDPYYFIYQAENLGYHSQIISAGRKINNFMPTFVVNNLVKKLLKNRKGIDSKIVIMGVTFKENTPDLRNSKVLEIIEQLKDYGFDITVIDPYVQPGQLMDIQVSRIENLTDHADVLLYAVDHNEFKEFSNDTILEVLRPDGLVVDLKNRFKDEDNINYWSL